MKKIRKKAIGIIMAITMLLNYILPITSVYANNLSYDDVKDSAEILLRGASDVVVNNGVATITYDGGIVTVEANGLQVDHDDHFNYGNHEGVMWFIYTTDNSITFNMSPNENKKAVFFDNGQRVEINNNTYTISNLQTKSQNNQGYQTEFVFEDVQQQNPDPNEPGNQNNPGNQNGNTVANIILSAGEGTYSIREYNPNTDTLELVDREYDDMAEFSINGSRWNPESNTISYNSDNEDETVDFTFETLWINRYYEEIVINDEPYEVSEYLDFDDRTSWLIANHGTQMIEFTIDGVPKADTYDIVVKHGENNGQKYFATFLWTADPEQADGDNYIGNSKLEFVKAEYTVGETDYVVYGDDIENQLVKEGNFYNYNSEDGFLSYGYMADVDFDDGSLTLPGNAYVTMRVVPEYGYQVTSVNGDGEFITTDDGVSEFTVFVEEGTAGYFRATVEQVDNTISPLSDKVKAGEIVLGESAKDDIQSGTVVLTVEDIELSEDKIASFEEQAMDAGNYTITNYLDINLDKVLYRGSADDVWSEQIHHLTDKALITLQLEDDVDINNLVIVHNIDDGDEFEIIEIESYDPETNTITFYTDSFSNYALATREEETYTITNGDFTVEFDDAADQDFELTIIDFMNLDEEMLALLLEIEDMTLEDYYEAIEDLKDELSEYGTLIGIYGIDISSANLEHHTKTKIKIKVNEEMEKYNVFKLICIDDGEEVVVDLTRDGDYLVGEVPHLSTYALVGRYDANPNTGDNVNTNIMLLLVSLTILGFASLYLRKKCN